MAQLTVSAPAPDVAIGEGIGMDGIVVGGAVALRDEADDEFLCLPQLVRLGQS